MRIEKKNCLSCLDAGELIHRGFNERGNVVRTGKSPCPGCGPGSVKANRERILARTRKRLPTE